MMTEREKIQKLLAELETLRAMRDHVDAYSDDEVNRAVNRADAVLAEVRA